MNEMITYMGYQWIQIEDGLVTIGINEDGQEELGEEITIHLPEESDSVSAGQMCGEIETENGPMNLYCPVDGVVAEVNEAVVENPGMLKEDCIDDGWLLKVEADHPDQIDMISLQNPDDENEDEGED